MTKFLAFAMAGISAVLFVACGSKDTKKEGEIPNEPRDIQFESYTFDLIGEYYGADSINTPGGKLTRFIGDGVLPRDIGDTDIHNLRETLIKMAGIRFSEGAAEPVMPDSTRITTLAASDTEACGEYISRLSTTLVTPRAIVWESECYAYACMAAHGNSSTKFLNFCLTDGKIISLADLMKPGYEKELQNLIRERLAVSGHELLIPLNQVEIPEQFGLTSKGLIFSYDPYQIAPYSEGTIQVELSDGDLWTILSPHGKYIISGISQSAE